MDSDATPSCAICGSPAPRGQECSCETERFEVAIKQAESRAMSSRLHEIREWVIAHARLHILQQFSRLSNARKIAHNAYLSSLPFYSIYVQYGGQPPLHPTALHQLQVQIAEAHAEMKRGVDADWRASVLRYPEVLDYFYGLVELRLPSEREPAVANPPFAQAGYADQGFEGGRREKSVRKAIARAQPPPPPPPLQPLPPSAEWPRTHQREPSDFMAPVPPIIQPSQYAPFPDDRDPYR